MNKQCKEHLLEIVRCSNFLNCKNTPCKNIVEYQNVIPRQLPEPWNGDIERAKILYISSNPSINFEEKFPSENWDENSIIDFFHFRFSKNKEYVKDYLYPYLSTGYPPKRRWVRYWASIRKISTKLLQYESVPGKDYALTEIVRCKSQKELGVEKATNTCSENFLNKTLSLTSAKILIVVGNKAKAVIEKKIGVKAPFGSTQRVQFDGIEKIFLFIPHPNSRGKKDYDHLLNREIREKVSFYL